MYHLIAKQQTDINLKDSSLLLSIKNFEKQMEYLSKSCNIISMQDLASHIKNKVPFPSNSVAITFDDGFKNNFINAFPILQKYNITATIFLITDYINTIKIDWFYKYFYFTKKVGLSEFIEEFKVEFPEYLSLISKVNQKKITNLIISIMDYYIDENVRENFLKGLYNKYKIKINKDEIKESFLSWKEIKKMDDSGILFGSHTSTHPILSKLDYEKAKKEIVSSKKNIEAKLNKKINLFAYPYGYKSSFDSNIKKILVDNNFLCAVSNIDGFNNLNSDLYELKRIKIVDEPFYCFKLRIEGFEGFIEKIYQKLIQVFKNKPFNLY